MLAATALSSSLAFLDGSVVNVALHAIRRDPGMGLSGRQWIVLKYARGLAACCLTAGAVADRIGLRRGFMLGTVAFAVSSGSSRPSCSAPLHRATQWTPSTRTTEAFWRWPIATPGAPRWSAVRCSRWQVR